ncbi:3-keto-5-aminohexanoate cleavage protein [Hyphomonas sp.]|jgi:uncharacterized protein (DUF849 family)|uniref:3-keto-5-aminohexanoate cleavage protein n=1 Tax=Hyphomonas sp. TaxID=87 RepID=UPI0037C06139
MSTPKPVIVTCAVTGSHQDFAKHPDYPITPAQIARDCIAAAKAGAAIAHVHARDPQTGWPSMDVAIYREIIHRVRDAGCDIILNLTTGEGAVFEPRTDNPNLNTDRGNLALPAARVAHVEELRPEICTLDAATMNFGEFAFINTPRDLRIMADRIIAAGTQPEIEVFDIGHVVIANRLISEGHLKPPFLFQFCLGIAYGAPATPEVIKLMESMIPAGSVWSAFGVGPKEFDVVASAVTLGGNVRVGLEDNMYLARGEFATNAQLVDRAVSIVEKLNRNIASPREAREIVGVNTRRASAGALAQ